jgi:hypothetical protein
MRDISLIDHPSPAVALREAGIAAARAGQELRAHLYLYQSIARDPNVADTWLWLAQVAAAPQQRIFYLRRALALNPTHPQAQAELYRLEQQLNGSDNFTPFATAAAKQAPIPTPGPAVPAVQPPADSLVRPLSRHLEGLVVVGAYGAALSLIEALTWSGAPRLGIMLYGLVLLSLFLNAAFGGEDKVKRFILTLAALPLLRMVSLSLPLSQFHPVGHYLAQTVPMFETVVHSITPVEIILDPTLSTSISAITVVILITLLVLKELVSTLEGKWQAFGRFLNIAIVPLLATFFIIVVIRMADFLR